MLIAPMTHTCYSPRNVTLLVIGAVLCLVNAMFVSLTAGFAIDSVRSARTFFAEAVLYLSILSVPLYLTLWRWSGFAARGMWAVTACSFIIVLVGGSHLLVLVLPLLLLSLRAELVHSGSRATGSY